MCLLRTDKLSLSQSRAPLSEDMKKCILHSFLIIFFYFLIVFLFAIADSRGQRERGVYKRADDKEEESVANLVLHIASRYADHLEEYIESYAGFK